jgi:hypothetical protein
MNRIKHDVLRMKAVLFAVISNDLFGCPYLKRRNARRQPRQELFNARLAMSRT